MREAGHQGIGINSGLVESYTNKQVAAPYNSPGSHVPSTHCVKEDPMPWHAFDYQQLPEVIGQSYTNQDVVLDGKSYQRCTFNECRLTYRGGPSRMVACYIGPNCVWQFEEAASYVLQFLQEIGWRIEPPAAIARLHNQ